MAKTLVDQINKYYAAEIYRFSVRYGDYVEVSAEGNEITVPARNGFLALLCSAKDLAYNGKVRLFYRKEGWDRCPAFTEYTFSNGKPVAKTGNCAFKIHGEDTVLL